MQLFRHIKNTFLAKVVSFVFSFIGGVFLTRILGPEGKGIQTFLVTNASILIMLIGLNLSNTFTYLSAKKNNEIQRFISFLIIYSLSASILFFLSIKYISSNELNIINLLMPREGDNNFYILFLSLLFFYGILNQGITGLLNGTFKFKTLNILLLITTSISAIIYYVYWEFNNSIEDISIHTGLQLFLIVSSILLSIRFVVFSYIFKPQIISVTRKLIKSIFNYGFISASTSIVNLLIKRIDIWIIGFYCGMRQVGIYAIAVTLSDMIIMLFLSITTVITPYFTKYSEDKSIEILSVVSRLSLLFAIISSIIMLLISNYFIPFVYGKSFTESVLPFQILCVGVVFLVFRNNFFFFNNARNTLKYNFYANVIALIITLILDFLFIPKFGILAASIISVGVYFISSIIIFISVKSRFKFDISHYIIPKRKDLELIWVYLAKNNK